MAKYHINPKTGNAGLCSAAENSCPFGAAEDHYSSLEEAREAYEETQAQDIFKRMESQSDPFSTKAYEIIEELSSKAATPRAKEIYSEILRGYSSRKTHAIYRASQVFAYKAELAHEFEKDEDAQLYYNGFMAFCITHDAKEEEQRHQGDLEAAIEKQDERSIAFHRQSLERSRLKTEEKLNRLLRGEAQFNIWDIIGAGTAGRVYRLKEVESTHPRIKEILAGSDDAYLGKASEEEITQAHREMEAHGQRLMNALADEYGDEIPSMEDSGLDPGPLKSDPDFVLIGGGGEMNVYLHKPTMLAYKVRHSNGLYQVLDASGTTNAEGSKIAVVKLQDFYENTDLSGLARLNASYLKTYFIHPTTVDGEETGIIVQPYLDPIEYSPYEPSYEERSYLRELGFNDYHSGNMSMNIKTGRLVLFDCLYVT